MAFAQVEKTRPKTPLANEIVIKEAFSRSLSYHLQRTGRYVLARKADKIAAECQANTGGAPLFPFLDGLPVLASIWDSQLRGWARFLAAFSAHAASFINHRRPRLKIREIETDLSEPHRNGRAVIRLTLSDNSLWYYKPRSGRQEEAWGRFVDVLNSAGFTPSLRAANVHVCRDHCWMPNTPTRRCKNVQERDKLAQRVGALLYLAHVFRAVDLHAANVITCGQHPVLVDCESFFHPETKLPVNREDRNSLSRSGMFFNSNQNPDWPLVDIRSREQPVNPSLKKQRLQHSRKEVIRGFQAMHDFLQSQKDNRLMKAAQARLQRLPTRRIYRPTTFYCRILRESLAPCILDEPRRYTFLHAKLSDGLCSTRTVESEIQQLLVGDIPFFSGPPATPRRLLTQLELSRALRELNFS